MSKVEYRVVNINRTYGCRAGIGPEYDVYIGRGSGFGNPFVIGRDGTRAEVIAKFRLWFGSADGESLRNRLRRNFGHRSLVFGCHCKPEDCHGDVYVEYLESIKTENTPSLGKVTGGV